MARGNVARRLLVVGAFVVVARWAVAEGETKPAPIEVPDDVPEAAVATRPRPAFRKRFATSLVFATMFFAGAAFTAGAGNELASVDSSSAGSAAVVDAAPTADATNSNGGADTTAATTTAESTTTDSTTANATTADATTADSTTTESTQGSPIPDATTSADTASGATASAQTTSAASSTSAAPTADATAAGPAAAAAPAPAVPAADPAADAVGIQPNASASSTSPITSTRVRVVAAKHRATRRRAHRAIAVVPAAVQVAIAPIPYQAIAFDPQAWLRNNAASAMGASAVSIAEHYLGVPYVWGGAAPASGFDCSGLTQFVYAQLGVTLPHYAAAQFAAFPKLDPTQLAPGDLVFFEPKFDGPGHVALYIGNDQIVEAPHTGALVRISSFSGAAAQMGFIGAVRPYAVAPEPVIVASLTRFS